MQEYQTLIRVLKAVVEDGRSMDRCFTAQDTPLGKQLCYGVARHFFSLGALMAPLLKKPIAEKHFDVELLIMGGIYSIDHLNRPAHASVNNVVDTTKTVNKVWAKALVNGVLRNYIRQSEALHKALKGSNMEAFSDHPEWLALKLKAAYPKQWLAIVAANNQQAPMTLRVNQQQSNIEDYIGQLDEIGLGAEQGEHATSALYLSQAANVIQLPGFEQGMVSVQDEASQLVAGLMQLAPGLTVLDACAAPGGKTCHILEQQPDIEMTALDIDASRLTQVQENLDRIGLKATLIAADFSDYSPEVLFDRILIDAPCSATGIIRRHPDIKLLRRESDIAKLNVTQSQLLAKAFSLLKPDGILIYSTCSILPDENEAIVAEFIANEASAQIIKIDEAWGQATDHGRQLLPDPEGSDGFFYSRIQKCSPLETVAT